MNLIVNGQSLNVIDNCYIIDLIDILEYNSKKIAIEVNKVIIAKSKYDSFVLNNKDKVEIINAVGGG